MNCSEENMQTVIQGQVHEHQVKLIRAGQSIKQEKKKLESIAKEVRNTVI